MLGVARSDATAHRLQAVLVACQLRVECGGSACAQAEGCWVFLSVLFPPGRAAWQAYATHTRRDDPGLDAPPEEASLFFKARPADGLPLPSGGADCLLHALLPTKVASPFAGHVQAADL